MKTDLGIIADDITGALLIAGVLEGEGIAAPVCFSPEAVENDGDIAVLATRTRLVPVAEAEAMVTCAAAALKAAGIARIAYKACASFDSTPEGNIGPAARILSDLAGGAPVLMNAGFPRFRATVHHGYLFYRGRLVSDSVKQSDPVTPMSDPDLVRFLSLQTDTPVGLIPHLTLLQGDGATDAAWADLRAAGHRYILTDCSNDEDVQRSLALALRQSAVVVASDPLVIGYAKALVAARRDLTPPAPGQRSGISGPGAVFVGSAGPTAEAQIARFSAEGHEVLALDLLDPEAEARALAWAAPRLGERPFAIVTAPDAEAVARAQSALGRMEAARRAEGLIAGLARALTARGLRRLVISGGETSGAVAEALGLRKVRALPETALGAGFCQSEGETPLALFFKSGKLGSEDVFAAALAQMRG
ncbi:four-carbon acid sugar kinase family protein [Falsigemmobacter faecalis]|uniref:Four-carbon acid sugar kinase family protein n=1 Tax=Falsigemmobacter faecalis TaxID=2488730 RepID=A0A3P3DPF8_9RHOB|nr:four-carbon acid sugar kinase family protein [Falsigemmobacter faecalis]RRH76139.1 four-carbon acid sugar kinase family protein [Falsigemmobacter faecalis]